jgi:hypothetical protein
LEKVALICCTTITGGRGGFSFDKISDNASVPPVDDPIAIRLHQDVEGAEVYDSLFSIFLVANKKSRPWN